MKKYNLSKIMKRAWELVKKAGMTISSGLKKAWEEAKSTKKSFTGYAKMVVVGRENYADDDDCKYVSAKIWEKADMRRIYFNDYKRRTVGYIDCLTKKIVNKDGFAKDFIQTMEKFASEYEF